MGKIPLGRQNVKKKKKKKKGRKSGVGVNQTNIGTVSKATMGVGETSQRQGGARRMGFPRGFDTNRLEN